MELLEATGTVRVAHMTPEEFGSDIPRKWNALEGIVTSITKQVTDGELSPLEGYRVIGCAVAETFDYKESHGSWLSASPIEIVSLLAGFPSFGGRNR
jgi:hypothetical protein